MLETNKAQKSTLHSSGEKATWRFKPPDIILNKYNFLSIYTGYFLQIICLSSSYLPSLSIPNFCRYLLFPSFQPNWARSDLSPVARICAEFGGSSSSTEGNFLESCLKILWNWLDTYLIGYLLTMQLLNTYSLTFYSDISWPWMSQI